MRHPWWRRGSNRVIEPPPMPEGSGQSGTGRISGIETEYGCLVDGADYDADAWPVRIKNHLFRKGRAGAIDLHYRDYEEPPGNGGFLRNGGRLYLDMGHVEYATPECAGAIETAVYDCAGECLLQSALEGLNAAGKAVLIKNNVDHHTGATFGCHENYLMERDALAASHSLGALLSFLATRQVFAGAGRVGQAAPLAFEFDASDRGRGAPFQISQRADHIVNDIYQWVQFNRAIINARDEPLADHHRYRRLHLLIGDSNASPFATALKTGTTTLVLALLERGYVPRGVALADAVMATREISRDPSLEHAVLLETGQRRSAMELQRMFLECTRAELSGAGGETDWILAAWSFVLDALEHRRDALLGAVDWVSKQWMFERFFEAENCGWDDARLPSLDIEYHALDERRGLFHAVPSSPGIGEFNRAVRKAAQTAASRPPATRAAGRSEAVRHFLCGSSGYVVNWDSIGLGPHAVLAMPDPFHGYLEEVREFLAQHGPMPGGPLD